MSCDNGKEGPDASPGRGGVSHFVTKVSSASTFSRLGILCWLEMPSLGLQGGPLHLAPRGPACRWCFLLQPPSFFPERCRCTFSVALRVSFLRGSHDLCRALELWGQ
jgi:hypothetical protein